MSTANAAPRVRWATLLAGTKTTLSILVPTAAALAPILTGVYYLSLAAGSGTAARQMMLLSDPVNTALALTVAFLPVVGAALVTGAVIATRGRFPLLSATLGVFLMTLMSLLNIDQLLFVVLAFANILAAFAAAAVPSEYPSELLRLFGVKGAQPEFHSRWAKFVRRHRFLDRLAVILALGSWAVCLATTIALAIGLTLTQLFSPQVYELRFADDETPTRVVWFSTGSEGTWYLTLKTERPELDDAALGTRDLEWSPSTPVSIVTCGLSAAPCGSGDGAVAAG